MTVVSFIVIFRYPRLHAWQLPFGVSKTWGYLQFFDLVNPGLSKGRSGIKNVSVGDQTGAKQMGLSFFHERYPFSAPTTQHNAVSQSAIWMSPQTLPTVFKSLKAIVSSECWLPATGYRKLV